VATSGLSFNNYHCLSERGELCGRQNKQRRVSGSWRQITSCTIVLLFSSVAIFTGMFRPVRAAGSYLKTVRFEMQRNLSRFVSHPPHCIHHSSSKTLQVWEATPFRLTIRWEILSFLLSLINYLFISFFSSSGDTTLWTSWSHLLTFTSTIPLTALHPAQQSGPHRCALDSLSHMSPYLATALQWSAISQDLQLVFFPSGSS
jgi:hypothetical protein